MRAATIMVDALTTKRIPRTLGCQIPLLLPPPATGTDDDPMKALEAGARQLEEQHPDILVINIVGGFAFADSHDTGVSLSAIYHDDDELARSVLTEIADLAWSMKEKAVITYPTADELLAKIKPDPKGPTLLVEPSDNIGGGAPGDCTGVLRAFLKHGTKNALLSIRPRSRDDGSHLRFSQRRQVHSGGPKQPPRLHGRGKYRHAGLRRGSH